MGGLARFVGIVLTLMALVPVMLARLPQGWVDRAMGHPWTLRIGLGIAVLMVLSAIRTLVYARLPAAVYTVGGRLVFPERGRKRVVRIEEVEEIFVESPSRPSEQVFAVALRDGPYHELCPVDWPGAGRLYATLARKLRRRSARAARREDRLAARQSAVAPSQPRAESERDQGHKGGGHEMGGRNVVVGGVRADPRDEVETRQRDPEGEPVERR